MSLLEVLERVRESLERNGRISYRMLQREFGLGDDALEELIEELVDIQRVALREERALAWNGAAVPARAPVPAAHVPAERKPLDYTPRHLADKILRSRSALEGERKLVTVMFADVKGSMELAESLDAEEWHRILDRFFQILSDGVHRFEGTVNQYTGDGIMALFGAPIAHEDHAQRACYAALELRSELRAFADELRRRHGVSFSTRIGLNSGEVVVGKIGDDLRMDYTAQGHTVGLAQRMEGLAEPGSVFLTEHTARLVEGYFALRGLGGFEIKGSAAPLEVYELESVGTQRTRLDRSRARGFSRFIGRAREVETLEAALARAVAGQGQVVGVVAEAGVGKSRLCVEFLESCRAQGLLVLEGHCPPHGRTLPLLPVFELLRGVFGITEADRDQVARERIAGRLLLLDKEFEPQLPLIWEFLGVPDPERPAPALDAAARQRQLFAFVRQHTQARSRREPAVLLIDDLHWIDPASDAFLSQIVEVVQQTRTLLVVNFRPEYRADWMQRSYYQQLALATLGPDDIRALAGELLGTHASVAELPAAIAARTQGNPFFTEEVVQTLAESGQLEGKRGAYRLKSDVAKIQVPATVQAILAARIDRLPEVQKRVLQTAAVIGKEVPESLLRAVAELPDDDLRGALAGLQAAEFLYERSLYPEHEYAFKHPLTHEVAYGSQLAERRKPLHAAVARAIEARDPERAGEHAALLAHHWDAADEPEPAAEWNRRAAIAVGMLDLADSMRRWRRVRELLERVPESQAQRSRAAEARSRLLWFGARGAIQLAPDAARALFEEACELGAKSGNEAAVIDVTTSYAQYLLYSVGDIRASLELSTRAVEAADRLGDGDLAINARFPAATAALAQGDSEAVLKTCDDGLELIDGDPDRGVDSMGLSLFTLYHGLRAGALASLGRAADAVAALAVVDTPAGRKHALSFHAARSVFPAQVHWLTGDHRGGLALNRQAIDALGDTTPTVQSMSRWSLGIALTLVEEWDEAGTVFEHSLEIARTARTYIHIEAELLGWLGRCAAERGEFERARALCSEAEATAERSGARIPRVLVPFARARILLRERGAGAAEEIERELSAALAAARAIKAPLYEPGIWLERAALAEAQGNQEQARKHKDTARALWLEMGSERNAARIG